MCLTKISTLFYMNGSTQKQRVTVYVGEGTFDRPYSAHRHNTELYEWEIELISKGYDIPAFVRIVEKDIPNKKEAKKKENLLIKSYNKQGIKLFNTQCTFLGKPVSCKDFLLPLIGPIINVSPDIKDLFGPFLT